MLDADLTPWIIEVNVSPDLSSSSPLDRVLKGNLAADVLHVVGIRSGEPNLAPDDPPQLTRAITGRQPSDLGSVPLRALGRCDPLTARTSTRATRHTRNYSYCCNLLILLQPGHPREICRPDRSEELDLLYDCYVIAM